MCFSGSGHTHEGNINEVRKGCLVLLSVVWFGRQVIYKLKSINFNLYIYIFFDIYNLLLIKIINIKIKYLKLYFQIKVFSENEVLN